MFEMIYIEKAIANHPITQKIVKKWPKPQISIDSYHEIFNRKAQNFRIQKQHPSLILAKKYGNFVLPTPEGYGIGGSKNFYFSHMLNCIFDCRYCFLQGMYRSGNYVIFVNFDDFEHAIINQINETPTYFFSGYDCDSLALENVTHFVERFLPIFEKYPKAFLELRTKSTNIHFLLDKPPIHNCIIAYSLTPKEIGKALEHKTPSLNNRLKALTKLQKQGWPIGLRFDPIIYCNDFKKIYRTFFSEVFSAINLHGIHSVSMGPFRLPKTIYKNIVQLYPDEKLFSHALDISGKQISYNKDIETELLHFCKEEILRFIPKDIFFPIS